MNPLKAPPKWSYSLPSAFHLFSPGQLSWGTEAPSGSGLSSFSRTFRTSSHLSISQSPESFPAVQRVSSVAIHLKSQTNRPRILGYSINFSKINSTHHLESPERPGMLCNLHQHQLNRPRLHIDHWRLSDLLHKASKAREVHLAAYAVSGSSWGEKTGWFGLECPLWCFFWDMWQCALKWRKSLGSGTSGGWKICSWGCCNWKSVKPIMQKSLSEIFWEARSRTLLNFIQLLCYGCYEYLPAPCTILCFFACQSKARAPASPEIHQPIT